MYVSSSKYESSTGALRVADGIGSAAITLRDRAALGAALFAAARLGLRGGRVGLAHLADS